MAVFTEQKRMTERWEKIIEQELLFYQSYPALEAEIHQKLAENELDIQIPITRIDDTGSLVKYAPSVEAQAIKRVTVRDMLQKRLKRAEKRIVRLLNAINQLSEEEQDIIHFLYLDVSYPVSKVIRLLGYKNIQELYKARDSALKSVLAIYEQERAGEEEEWNQERKRLRLEMARGIRMSG